MDSPNQPTPQFQPDQIPQWLRAFFGIPLVLLGGIVTTLSGLILITCIGARVSGGPPDSNSGGFLIFWIIFGAAPFVFGISLLKTAPARKRFWWCALLAVLGLFLVVGFDGNFGPRNWHQLFRREKLPGTDAIALKRTVVSPYLETKIEKGTNLLWCGTFQLVWNEACKLTGADLQFGNEHPMISELNRHSFTKESLDDSCYVAMAGFVKDNIHDKIAKAVDEKFKGTFKPRFIPDKALAPRPEDFVAYACLYKNLSFPTAFERLDETLKFGGVPVSAFGIGRYKPTLEKVYPQVLIWDYRSEDDFVIELKTKSAEDKLILAKIQPSTTFNDTVATVTNRISHGHVETSATNDLLLVPRVKINLTRRYSEIEGLRLVSKNTKIASDLVLTSAIQDTEFEMNEKGVELKSEAHMAFGCAKEEQPVPKHKMIFDKPFLILMQHNAKAPYFAFWVDNPEALISWK